MNTYTIGHHPTKKQVTIQANSAQEACEVLGWLINDCYVEEHPTQEAKVFHYLQANADGFYHLVIYSNKARGAFGYESQYVDFFDLTVENIKSLGEALIAEAAKIKESK